MMKNVANTPDEYRKPSKAGGSAPLTKSDQVKTPLSESSIKKIRKGALVESAKKHSPVPTKKF